MAIKYNGNPAIVLEVHHRTPGNLRAFVQAIIRYINTGKSADVRFGSTDKVELVDVERKQLDFSYKDNEGYHFMEPETYETITFQEDFVKDVKDYLTENLSVQVLYTEGKPVEVELPSSVSMKVIESAEGVRGDTASNVTKPAVLETGKTVNVPLFIKEGEIIKIDTRTGTLHGPGLIARPSIFSLLYSVFCGGRRVACPQPTRLPSQVSRQNSRSRGKGSNRT